MVRPRCVMWKNGKCNSMYGKGIKCDGYNPPKGCPYDFRKDEVKKVEEIIELPPPSDEKLREKLEEMDVLVNKCLDLIDKIEEEVVDIEKNLMRVKQEILNLLVRGIIFYGKGECGEKR